jgi:NADPH:quinone reductase-like Zn-dependent oxidoreductase
MSEPQALPATTREVVLETTEAGYRWNLITTTMPLIGEHQVLVRVRAVSLNHGELDMLERDPAHEHAGMIVGSDAAGDVVAVGNDVHGIHNGERVTSLYFRDWTDGPFTQAIVAGQHGWTSDGVFGDYIALDDTAVAPIPGGLSYEEAATLPTAGLTAWTAITESRRIRQGDVVLVQGTGGVSVFALQFAAAMGARVIVTSSSDQKLKRALALGAHDGINYRSTPAWDKRVLELTDSHGADLIVDVGGNDTLALSVKSLADSGVLSVVGGLSGYSGTISAMGLLVKRARAQSIFVGSRADYLRMSAFVTAHRIHPVVDRVFPLEQYQEALQYLKNGGFVGKVVIRWQ